jgi:ankyrin repeat protein
MYAAERSRGDAVALLLAKGADTKLKNEGGDTAAALAAQRKDFALARQINNALNDHGMRFFQRGQQAITAPATARWKKKP